MLILPSFTVGDTATLYAPRDLTCRVERPDGSSILVLDRLTKDMSIALAMAGTWRYVFSDGSTGELVVADAPAPAPSVVP